MFIFGTCEYIRPILISIYVANKIVDIDKLKALRSKLKIAMRHDATWLATEMNTEGLLSDDNHKAISDSRVNIEPNGKVEMMISDLFDKIELDSDNLNTFVAILKKKPKGYKEAIKFLEGITIFVLYVK